MTTRRRRWMLATVPLLFVLGAVSAVHRLAAEAQPEPPCPDVPSTAEPLAVEWGGCVRVEGAEPVRCIFEASTPLRLWVDDPLAPSVEACIDAQPVPLERYAVDEQPGRGLRVALPATARTLVLHLPGSDRAWTLAVESTESRGDRDEAELAQIEQLARDAATILQQEPADWTSGRRQAMAAIDHAQRTERWSVAVDIGLMASYFLWRAADRPKEARELLDHVAPMARRYPRGKAVHAAATGHHQWARGHLSDAARSYRAATRYGLQVEDPAFAVEPMVMYAEVLAELGYMDAAAHWSERTSALLERLLRDLPEDQRQRWSCDLGSVLRTRGWIDLLLRRRGHPDRAPRELYARAEALFDSAGRCPSPQKLEGTRLGLAEAHLLDGRAGAALRSLRGIDGRTADERMRVDDLRLRAALALGARLEDLRPMLDRLSASATSADTAEARWRLAVRRADVLVRSDDLDGAVLAYRASEHEADALVTLAAFGIGRAMVDHAHLQGTTGLANALIALGRPEDASCTLREAAARRAQLVAVEDLAVDHDPEVAALVAAYREAKQDYDRLSRTDGLPEDEQLQARRRAEFVLRDLRGRIDDVLNALGRTDGPTCEQLSARAPGEMLLGLYPDGDDWLVIATDDERTTAHRAAKARPAVLAGDDEALSGAVLEPLAERLGRAARLRVLATDDAWHLDVHTLPWHGKPLLATLPVAYGLERPRRDPVPWSSPPRVMLLSDPSGNLAQAKEEIERIAARLHAAGWEVDRLPSSEADVATVLSSMAEAEIMHFAGHSQYPGIDEHGRWPPYAAGTPGPGSYLVLAKQQRLDVHDVVLSPHVPRVAILDGCEAGALTSEVGGMSLAEAFIAAGSEAVVASPGHLDDRWASTLGVQLWDEHAVSERFDAAAALRRAQLVLWDADERKDDIGRYRVFVP